MKENHQISIVVPCYNEAQNLEVFYAQTKAQIQSIQSSINPELDYEFIFVNDGSQDKTLEVLEHLSSRDYKIKVLNFSRNFGKESAILAGLQKSQGECIVLLDADLQHPIELLTPMYEEYYLKDIDIVCAKRTNRSCIGGGDSKLRSFLSETFYKINSYFSEIKLESGMGDYRLMSREVVDAILELKEYHRFSKGIFEWVGFNKSLIPYSYVPRHQGVSAWNFWKLFKYGIEGIISFSTMPLRLAFVLGFLAALFSIIYGGYILFDTLLFGNPIKGYPSLMCIITFFSGLHLIVLGIIGEYIARIYEQVKKRPHYILKRKRNEKSK